LNAIESAIQQVERLYQSVVGQPPPPLGDEPFATIPPEREPFRFVEEQIERLNQMLGATMQRITTRAPWTPPTSLWETADGYVLQVDLPGVPRAAVQVSVVGSALDIVGERPAPAIDGQGGGRTAARTRWSERVGGSFRRSVPLPGDADLGEVHASLRDGVLEVRLGRRTGAGRSIQIE
jgi:HSP20 family protein